MAKILGKPKETPQTFAEWMGRKTRLSDASIANYSRIAARWERTGASPETWLKKTIRRDTPASTATTYIAGARQWCDFQGRELDLSGVTVVRSNPSGFVREGLQDHELAAYSKAISTLADPHKTILQLLPLTGLRISEACGLSIDAYTKKGARHGIGVTGKGAKMRWVPLGDKALKIVSHYVHEISHPDSDWLFASPQSLDRPVAPTTVRAQLRNAREGLPGGAATVTPHVLRHTYATKLMQNGVSLRVVQALLGHNSINTTALYMHPSTDDLASAVDGL